jgi:hypothetical protein
VHLGVGDYRDDFCLSSFSRDSDLQFERAGMTAECPSSRQAYGPRIKGDISKYLRQLHDSDRKKTRRPVPMVKEGDDLWAEAPACLFEKQLDPIAFQKLMEIKGWAAVDLAGWWGMAPETLSRHVANPQRPNLLNDALLGLSPYTALSDDGWRRKLVSAARGHSLSVARVRERHAAAGWASSCTRRGTWPPPGPLVDPPKRSRRDEDKER